MITAISDKLKKKKKVVCDPLKEQTLAVTIVKEPSSRACGCFLRP